MGIAERAGAAVRRWRPGAELSHRSGLALLAVALLAFLSPALFGGRVLYPHDNSRQVGLATEGAGAGQRGPAKSDLTSNYVPEIQAHLGGGYDGWLATWNPYNEFGRPVFASAHSPAFIVGHVFSKLTRDPFRHYTAMVALAICGAGLFAYLFLRERSLHPLACLTGALAISVGPFALAWAPVLLWGFCWTFAALFAVERWLSRPGVWGWIGLTFAFHGVLMTGYPQLVVMLGWISAGWVVLRVLESRRGIRQRVGALGWIGLAALVGLLSVAPVYLDQLVEWQRSPRADIGATLIDAAVPLLDSSQRAAAFWLQVYDVFWLGDPFGRGFPNHLGFFRGFSLSPLYAGLAAASLLAWRAQRGWYWMACAALALVATVHVPLLRSLRHLGLAFSALPALAGGLLPLTVMVAIGADRILRAPPSGRLALGLLAALPLTAAGLVLALVDLPVNGAYALVGALLGLGTALFAWMPRPQLLLILLVTVTSHQGLAMLHWQPRASIHTDSPLVAELRRRTADGSRFAWIGPRPEGLLVPNQEILLGVPSVHGYNSFPSREFSHWAEPLKLPEHYRLSYSRRFEGIRAVGLLGSTFLTAGGVSTLVSCESLNAAFAEEQARFGEVGVWALRDPGLLEARLGPEQYHLSAERGARASPAAMRAATGARRLETGCCDRLRFAIEPAETETLLFVSQQYHPFWTARADSRELATVLVNGIYQGVVLPPGAAEVELAFEPWVRWALVPQALFVLAGFGAVMASLRRRRHPLPASPPG